MTANASPPARGKRRRTGSAYVREAIRRSIETLPETSRQKEKVLAELARRPTRHLKVSIVDLIREDRDRH